MLGAGSTLRSAVAAAGELPLVLTDYRAFFLLVCRERRRRRRRPRRASLRAWRRARKAARQERHAAAAACPGRAPTATTHTRSCWVSACHSFPLGGWASGKLKKHCACDGEAEDWACWVDLPWWQGPWGAAGCEKATRQRWLPFRAQPGCRLCNPDPRPDRVFNILKENNPELTGERRRTTLKPPQVRRAAERAATWLLQRGAACCSPMGCRAHNALRPRPRRWHAKARRRRSSPTSWSEIWGAQPLLHTGPPVVAAARRRAGWGPCPLSSGPAQSPSLLTRACPRPHPSPAAVRLCKSMNRNHEHVQAFLLAELGTSGGHGTLGA